MRRAGWTRLGGRVGVGVLSAPPHPTMLLQTPRGASSSYPFTHCGTNLTNAGSATGDSGPWLGAGICSDPHFINKMSLASCGRGCDRGLKLVTLMSHVPCTWSVGGLESQWVPG